MPLVNLMPAGVSLPAIPNVVSISASRLDRLIPLRSISAPLWVNKMQSRPANSLPPLRVAMFPSHLQPVHLRPRDPPDSLKQRACYRLDLATILRGEMTEVW